MHNGDVRKSAKPLLIGIAGGSGCGKTYLAHQVQRDAGEDKIAVLSMDQYFRTDSMQVKVEDVNFDHPGHLDFRLMIRHLKQLKAGKAVKVPSYDFQAMKQTLDAVLIEPRPVIIVEGLFVLAEPAVKLFDLTCFLDVESDERLLGRILRDLKERGSAIHHIIDRYQRLVRPSYYVFVAPTAQNADVVVDFTYRRAFFGALLTHVVRDYVTGSFDLHQLVGEVRKENFHPGFRPQSSSMPFSTDIFKLAQAYPQSTFPRGEKNTHRL